MMIVILMAMMLSGDGVGSGWWEVEVGSHESSFGGTAQAAYAKPRRELIAWPQLDRENRDNDR